ncbi:MAG: hypothetical protein JXQ72_15945 [Anaerolineae bacterium]|nr:hypothetical protein [Anaerolineae bacterium]
MKNRWITAGLMAGLAALLVGGIALPGGVWAAPPAQGGPLVLFAETPISGTLSAAAPEQSYTFACNQDQVLSVLVTAESDGLTPALMVLDAGGSLLAEGKPYTHGIAAEAFIVPRDGTCTATVRAASGAGSYTIRLLGGYAQIDHWDPFDGVADPLRFTWINYDGDAVDYAVQNNRLWMQVTRENMVGYADPEEVDFAWSDFYIQTDVVIEGSPSYYEYGFLFHLDQSDDVFYALTFSSDGDWSLYLFDEEWQAIQDYTVSPVVNGAEKAPTIGMYLNGNVARVYFDHRFVGEARLPASPSEGRIALTGVTGVGQTDILTLYFDNLVITTPGKPGSAISALPFGVGQGNDANDSNGEGPLAFLGATNTPVAPPTAAPTVTPLPPLATATPPPSTGQTLTNWESGQPRDIVRELQTLGIAPSGGSVTLNVPTSFGSTSAAGWHYYPLGRGRAFADFVLAFDARLLDTGAGSGCGAQFRSNTQGVAVGVIFEDGAAFLGYYDSNGDLSDNSFYNAFSAVRPGEGASNRVFVVAVGGQVTMYVNGQLFASGAFSSRAGEVALEVYVNDNNGTQDTYCQLDNIWVWEF